MFELKKTWDKAREACISKNAHLVSIHSPDEQTFIVDNLLTPYNTWTGGKDFKWEDGSSFNFTYFIPGEGLDGGCVIIGSELRTSNREWADNSCGYQIYYVCKQTLLNNTGMEYN